MKRFAKFIYLFIILTKSAIAAPDIRGFWKTVNEEGRPECILAVYDHKGLCYGRIIATYSESDGKVEDSIYNPIKKAPGVAGNPPYCGLDIIWNLQDNKMVHKGQILDPRRGKVYKAELWTEGPDLIVRGKLLMFGRSQRWHAVKKEDLPEGFKLPDLNDLVPTIPKTN